MTLRLFLFFLLEEEKIGLFSEMEQDRPKNARNEKDDKAKSNGAKKAGGKNAVWMEAFNKKAARETNFTTKCQ